MPPRRSDGGQSALPAENFFRRQTVRPSATDIYSKTCGTCTRRSPVAPRPSHTRSYFFRGSQASRLEISRGRFQIDTPIPIPIHGILFLVFSSHHRVNVNSKNPLKKKNNRSTVIQLRTLENSIKTECNDKKYKQITFINCLLRERNNIKENFCFLKGEDFCANISTTTAVSSSFSTLSVIQIIFSGSWTYLLVVLDNRSVHGRPGEMCQEAI